MQHGYFLYQGMSCFDDVRTRTDVERKDGSLVNIGLITGFAVQRCVPGLRETET